MKSHLFNKTLILLIIFCGIFNYSLVSADSLIRELWRGEFEQSQPLQWKGKMELYIKYAGGEEAPYDFIGVLTWPELGNARSHIVGTKTNSKIKFVEVECFSGDCTKIFSGGTYEGVFKNNQSEIQGESSLQVVKDGAISFSGRFSLKRVKE